MSQLSTRHKLQAPQPSCFNKPIRWLFDIVKKCRSFTFFKHKHNHAIRVRSLKAPQGVLRVIPWKTWSWSGGDFQRKSIEVTSEKFESVTKHWDLNKSKKVLRILPSKSKLIFIEHQDIECLQVCKKKDLCKLWCKARGISVWILSPGFIGPLHRSPQGPTGPQVQLRYKRKCKIWKERCGFRRKFVQLYKWERSTTGTLSKLIQSVNFSAQLAPEHLHLTRLCAL